MGIRSIPGLKGPNKATKFVDNLLYPDAVAGAVAYSLLGDAGSYTYAGVAATFTVGRQLPGATGAYAYSGQAATFTVGRKLPGATGAYAYSGVAATFRVGRQLSGAFGAYSYSGQDAAFTITQVSTAVPAPIGHPAPIYYLKKRFKGSTERIRELIDSVEEELKAAAEPSHSKPAAPIVAKPEVLRAAPISNVQPLLQARLARVEAQLEALRLARELEDEEELIMLLAA